jgi:hypothetical protein
MMQPPYNMGLYGTSRSLDNEKTSGNTGEQQHHGWDWPGSVFLKGEFRLQASRTVQ